MLIQAPSVSACMFGSVPASIEDAMVAENIFVARLGYFEMYRGAKYPRYAVIHFEDIDILKGSKPSKDEGIYLAESSDFPVRSVLTLEKFIVATITPKPFLHRYSVSYFAGVGNQQSNWVLKRPCRAPLIIQYSEEKYNEILTILGEAER